MKNVVFVSVILVIINGKMDILYIKGCFFLYYVNIFFFRNNKINFFVLVLNRKKMIN